MQLLTDGHAVKEGFRFIRASDRHAVFQTHTENPAHLSNNSQGDIVLLFVEECLTFFGGVKHVV